MTSEAIQCTNSCCINAMDQARWRGQGGGGVKSLQPLSRKTAASALRYNEGDKACVCSIPQYTDGRHDGLISGD